MTLSARSSHKIEGDKDSLDTPDNQRLSTTAITRSEDALDVRRVLLVRRLDVRASILLDAGPFQHLVLWTQETKCKEDKLSREELLRSGHLLHLPPASAVLGPLHADSVETLELALVIKNKLLRGDAELPWVLSEMRSNLRMAVVGTEDPGPLRPWVVATTTGRRLGQQLKVDHGLGTMAHSSSDTVVTSITTTNDDDVLALRIDVAAAVLEVGIEECLSVELEILHGKVDAVSVAVGDLEVAGPGCASGENNGVVLGAELGQRDVDTDVSVGNEGLSRFKSVICSLKKGSDTYNSLSSHQVDATLDDRLVELHAANGCQCLMKTNGKKRYSLGDTIHQETSHTVVAVVHGDEVTGLVKLVGAGETGGTRSDNGNTLASSELRDLRRHPTHLEALVDDRAFNALDSDRLLVDAQHTRTLARSRANTTSKLGEVVCHEESVESVLPLSLEDEVVPLGDDVGDRATSFGLAEGNTAIHATS